jgi:hypothetical protein
MLTIDATRSFHSTLAPGEPGATGAKSLSPAAQSALLACAIAGRLIGTRLGAWHTPDPSHHPRPIRRATLNVLRRLKLVTVQVSSNTRHARLTSYGHWYARTLCSAIAGDLSTITSEGVEACHIED